MISRRNFLLGGSTLVAGLALVDAVSVGRVYFFPKEIKIANSLTDPARFVSIDELQEEKEYGSRIFNQRYRPILANKSMLRREIYDRQEFWSDSKALPIKVEYKIPEGMQLPQKDKIYDIKTDKWAFI